MCVHGISILYHKKWSKRKVRGGRRKGGGKGWEEVRGGGRKVKSGRG